MVAPHFHLRRPERHMNKIGLALALLGLLAVCVFDSDMWSMSDPLYRETQTAASVSQQPPSLLQDATPKTTTTTTKDTLKTTQNDYQKDEREAQIKALHFSSVWAAEMKAVTSGKGEQWQRTYAKAPTCFDPNHKDVVNKTADKMMVVPYEKGFGAGPIIDCPDMQDCDPLKSMWQLDSYQSVLKGEGHHFRLPGGKGYPTLVLDRTRFSSASSACFMDPTHVVVASFSNHALYLYEFDVANRTQTLLQTVKARNAIDLIDCDTQRNRIAASILFERGIDIFHYDSEKKEIKLYKEINAFEEPTYKNDYLHDVAFLPTSDRVVVSATMRGRQSSVHKTLRLTDYESETTLADFNTTLNSVTHGHFIKGIRVIDDKHILVAAVPYGVFTVGHGCILHDKPQTDKLHAILVLLRMDFDINDIIQGRAPPAQSNNFTLVDWVEFRGSTPEGLDYHNGLAISADQINDQHLFFHVDVNADKPIRYAGKFSGCTIPHGVGFHPEWDLLALTCYGDNSVWIHKLSHALETAKVKMA